MVSCVPAFQNGASEMEDEIPGGLSWSSSYMCWDASEV